METISITRALNSLKLLDKRIQKKIQTSEVITMIIGQENQRPETDSKAEFQSVLDLIEYRNRLKSALMISNANTTVRIGKEEMTVIEAIEKKTSIEYQKSLLSNLVGKFQKMQGNIDYHNAEQENRLDKLLEANFSKDLKVRGDDFIKITESFWKANKASACDPLKLEDIIYNMSEEIDTFENEVDLVLSESNAVTKISV